MENRYNLKRFIKVKSGKVVDTTLLLPHTEVTQLFYHEPTEKA